MKKVTFKNNKTNVRLADVYVKSLVKNGYTPNTTTTESEIVIEWSEEGEKIATLEAPVEVSPKEKVYNALVSNIENNNLVYLDNAYAKVSDEITPAQWAGYLSALTKEGRYNQIDSCFGEVVCK